MSCFVLSIIATILTSFGLSSRDPNRKYTFYRFALYINLAARKTQQQWRLRPSFVVFLISKLCFLFYSACHYCVTYTISGLFLHRTTSHQCSASQSTSLVFWLGLWGWLGLRHIPNWSHPIVGL